MFLVEKSLKHCVWSAELINVTSIQGCWYVLLISWWQFKSSQLFSGKSFVFYIIMLVISAYCLLLAKINWKMLSYPWLERFLYEQIYRDFFFHYGDLPVPNAYIVFRPSHMVFVSEICFLLHRLRSLRLMNHIYPQSVLLIQSNLKKMCFSFRKV